MKLRENQVVYLRDEKSLAIVDNPCTSKGNATFHIYPLLSSGIQKRNSSRNNRCGGLLQDGDDGHMWFDRVLSQKLIKDRKLGSDSKAFVSIYSRSDYWRHTGYRVLPHDSSNISSVSHRLAEMVHASVAMAEECLEELEKNNAAAKHYSEELKYLKVMHQELQK